MVDLAKHGGRLEIRLAVETARGPVEAVLEVTRAGLRIRRPGGRKQAEAPWWKVLRALSMDPSARSKWYGDVERFLTEGKTAVTK